MMLLVMLSIGGVAAQTSEKTYTVGDELYYDADFKKVSAQQAALVGVVTDVNASDNTATIEIRTKVTHRLVARTKRVASGKQYDLLMEETLYYKDGQVQEVVVRKYPKGKPVCYDRKYYNPDGSLLCNERQTKKGLSIVYYDENGKKTDNPTKKIAPYMENPAFPGGQQALFKFLSETVKYPTIARENGIQGRVVCQFVVAKNGAIEDVEVVQSGGDPSLDKEAVRVIKAMPKWHPGMCRGKFVRVKYTVPVNFRL